MTNQSMLIANISKNGLHRGDEDICMLLLKQEVAKGGSRPWRREACMTPATAL